jgi:hypothetical protein
MPRKHTASFILELPMKTDPGDERACAIILATGRNIGNAVLSDTRSAPAGLVKCALLRRERTTTARVAPTSDRMRAHGAANVRDDV